MTDVFHIFRWQGRGHWLCGRKVEAQVRTPVFLLFSICGFFLFGWWKAECACARIHKRANMQTHVHAHAHFYLNFLTIDFVAQTRERKDTFQHDSGSLKELHVDSSFMLQMFFQFKNNQNIFSPPDTIIISFGSNLIHRDWEWGRRINRNTQQKQVWYSILQWRLIPLSKGFIFLPAGSIATKSMDMFWTVFSILLANLRWEKPWACHKLSLGTFGSLSSSLIGYQFYPFLGHSEDKLLLLCLGQ